MGTVLWSTRSESQAEVADVSAKLAVDPSYMEYVLAHAHYFAPTTTDALANVVSSTLDPTPRSIYELTTATIANGKIAKAMEFGVRVQQFVATATGLPTAFSSSVYGAYGSVGWLIGASTMSDIDRVRQVEATNTEFHALIEEAGQLFIEGSGTSSLIEKIN